MPRAFAGIFHFGRCPHFRNALKPRKDTNAIEDAVSGKVLKNQVFHFDSAGKTDFACGVKTEESAASVRFQKQPVESPSKVRQLVFAPVDSGIQC